MPSLISHFFPFPEFSVFYLEITTVEGILGRCISGLEQDQPLRRTLDPDSAEKIDVFIQILMDRKSLKNSFTLVRDYFRSFTFSPV